MFARDLHPASYEPLRFAILLWLIPGLLLWSPTAGAIEITVTTLDDNTTVDGQVSLREAIQAANTDTGIDGSAAGIGPDTIRFDDNLSGGTITLDGTPLPNITDSVTITAINAGGITLDGDQKSQILIIESGTTVNLEGLTITRARDDRYWGGAIRNYGALRIINSAITDNESTGGSGGGIYNERNAKLNIVNTTIARNRAAQVGGGVYSDHSGVVNIVNSTIIENRCDSDDDNAFAQGGGVMVANTARFYLYNSIVAGNKGNLGIDDDLGDPFPGYRNVDIGKYNVIGSAAMGSDLVDGVDGNQVGIDPMLGPLQDNGGVSVTALPMSNSPTIDAANKSLVLDGTGDPLGAGTPPFDGPPLVNDQRGPGFTRFAGPGGLADIGAAEFIPQPLLVTTLVDEDDGALGLGAGDSLRELINEQNAVAGMGAIGFDVSLAGASLVLNGTQLPIISDDLLIGGLGAAQTTINGNQLSRIIEIAVDVHVEIRDLTMTSGSVGALGGAISNEGVVYLSDCALTQNVSGNDGGALFNNGTAHIDSCTFTDNRGQEGGAIWNGAHANAFVSNSTFFDNSAEFDGGAIYNNVYGRLDLRNTTITGNYADADNNQFTLGEGGGVRREPDSFVFLYSSIIAGNIDAQDGAPNDFSGQPDYARSSYNIIGVDTSFGVLNPALGNLVGITANPIDPKLGSLADNGGPTLTFALLPGSPAIDKGNPATPDDTSSTCTRLDQRGVSRIGLCDMGAFELPDTDTETDGTADEVDNCPVDFNPLQLDTDDDGSGDVCDVCPDDDSDSCDPEGSAAAVITPENGGAVTTGDGLMLDFDPGDVREISTITVIRDDPADASVNLMLSGVPAAGMAVATWELQPDGTVFDGPVTLTIVADVSALNSMQRENLDLYIENGVGGYDAMGAVCNVVELPPATFTATCEVEIGHFTMIALVAPQDSDLDGIPNNFGGIEDNCPLKHNPAQVDVCSHIFGDGFEASQED